MLLILTVESEITTLVQELGILKSQRQSNNKAVAE